MGQVCRDPMPVFLGLSVILDSASSPSQAQTLLLTWGPWFQGPSKNPFRPLSPLWAGMKKDLTTRPVPMPPPCLPPHPGPK